MEATVRKKSLFSISERNKKIFIEVVIVLFFLLFVYTAVSKFQTFNHFEKTLEHSPLIGGYGKFIAWVIPSIEILISLILLIPSKKIIGLFASLILMILFTTYLVYMVNSGSTLPCQCGGVISKMSWTQHIWFNIVFIFLALTALIFSRSMERSKHST